MSTQPLDQQPISMAEFYTQQLQQLAAESQVTFYGLQTPGWTSLVQTERSEHQQSSLRKRILSKLNSNSQIIANSKFNGEETPSLLICQQERQKMGIKIDKANKENEYKPRYSVGVNQPSNKSHKTNSHRVQTQGAAHNDDTPRVLSQQSSKISTPKQSIQRSSSNKSINVQKAKRFKQITVHEHLFQQSKHISTKKLVNKILEEQYQDKYVLSFQPQINSNSGKLAELRYSRTNSNGENDRQSKAGKDTSKIHQEQQKTKQQCGNKAISQLFIYLSQNRQAIDIQTIQGVVEHLPLACVRFLSKIIAQVYAGSRYSQGEFTTLVKDKQMVSSRQGLINTFEKWLLKSQKQKEGSTQLSGVDLCQ